MKKLSTTLLIAVFVFACGNLIAQSNYFGAVKPAGFHNLPPVSGAPSDAICNPCAIPNNEADIPNEGLDVTNGGCNYPPAHLSNAISIGETRCGRINGFLFTDPIYGLSDYRDLDWYKLTLTATTTVYFSGYMNFAEQGVLFIANTDCDNLYAIAYNTINPGVAGSVSYTLPAGEYYLIITSVNYGLGIGGDYMVKVSTDPPGPPASWCAGPSVPTLSQWGLIILGITLLGFGTFYIVRGRS